MQIPHTITTLYRRFEERARINLREFALNNFWLTGGRIIAIVSGIGLTIAFANLLPPETYGTYKYILAAAGIVSAFSLNGLSTAIARAAATGKASAVPRAVRIGMLWNVPASIVAFGIGCYYLYHQSLPLGVGFIFIAFTTAFSNSFGYAKSLLASSGDFRRSTLIGFPRMILPILIMIGTLLLTKDILYILAAYFITNTIASWSLYVVQMRALHIQASDEYVPELIRYAKHMSVLGFFLLIVSQIDQFLIWHSIGAAALAAYSIARSPINEITNQLGNLLAIAFPRFAKKSVAEVGESLRLRLIQMFIISVLVVVAYILFAPFLFTVLFPRYSGSILFTQVLALSLLFQPKGLIDTALIAHGHVRSRYIITSLQLAVLLALYLVLIPLYGIWGAVAAVIGGEAASAVILIIAYRILYTRSAPA